MARPFAPSVITANALRGGEVIYLAADGRWTRRLAEAEIFTDEAVARQRLLEAAADGAEAVGVALAAVATAPGGPQPASLRERIRACGPTVPVPPRPPAGQPGDREQSHVSP